MSKNCLVYKYEHKGRIIYIGKSDCDFRERIRAHRKDKKFQPYLDDDLKIFYFSLPNPAFTTIYETYLINKYQPLLNEKMKYDDILFFDIPELEWHEVDRAIAFGLYTTIRLPGIYKSSITFTPKKYSLKSNSADVQLSNMNRELKAKIYMIEQDNLRLRKENTMLQTQTSVCNREAKQKAVDRLCT